MQITRTDLTRILDTVLPGSDKKATGMLPGSDTIVLTDKAAYTYNGNASISCPLPEGTQGFSWAFKSEAFYKLVKALKGDLVELVEDGDICRLVCGDTEAELPRLSVIVMQHVIMLENTATDNWKPAPADFSDAVALTVQAVKSDSPHRGIYMDKHGSMTSFDGGTRFNHYQFEGWDNWSFRLDEPNAVLLSKVRGVEQIGVSPEWVHFRTSSGATFHLRRAQEQGIVATGERFKEMEAGLGKLTKLFAGRLPTGIADAVQGAAVVADSTATDMGMLQTLTLEIGKEAITVIGKGAAGRVRRKVKLAEPLETEPNCPPIVAYASFLVEASRKAMEFEFYKRSDTSGMLVFRSDKYAQIVSVSLAG